MIVISVLMLGGRGVSGMQRIGMDGYGYGYGLSG